MISTWKHIFLDPCLTVLMCIFQGAGAATCAWLCWRTKPPYTSRTRTRALSDFTVASPAPSTPGSHPRSSDLLSVQSSRLCQDVAEPDCRSAFRSPSIYSVSGGTQNQNRPQISQHGYQNITTNLPAKFPEACRSTRTYCCVNTVHTHTPGLLQRQKSCSNHSNCCLHGSSQERTD